MGQQFVRKNETIKHASLLKIGELGEVIEGSYSGLVVTKIYDGSFVAVYSPPGNSSVAFRTTWCKDNLTYRVRILVPGEQVILSND